MHHVAGSFMVAQDPGVEANIFQGMQPEDRATLRANMIDLILGAPDSVRRWGPGAVCVHVHLSMGYRLSCI